jgi:hypothetical protein
MCNNPKPDFSHLEDKITSDNESSVQPQPSRNFNNNSLHDDPEATLRGRYRGHDGPGYSNISRPVSSPNNQGRNILQGRISHIEQRDERPPTNIFRIFSWILIWLYILVPFCVLFVGSWIISLSFAIIGFQTLSQFFNPLIWTLALAELLEVVVLRRLRSDDKIPVMRGMIVDSENQEHFFIMYGPLQRGHIIEGQNIRLTGRWDRGSFIAREGLDLTTRAEIRTSYRNRWQGIFYFLFCLAISTGFLLFINWNFIENILE